MMIKKSICLAILAATILNGSAVVKAVDVPPAYSPFYEYSEKYVRAVFVGNSGVFTNEVETTLCEFIEENFKKEVLAEKILKNEMTAMAATEMADTIISKNPDIIYYQVSGGNSEEVEGFVRKVLKAKRNTIIIFITMPGDENDDVLKVANYYGAETIDFDAYTERRTVAGVLKEKDLYSEEKLTEEGIKQFTEYTISHYGTAPYIFASYPEKALTGGFKDEIKVPEENENKQPENSEMLSPDEAKELLKNSIIASVKKDKLLVNGKELLFPDQSIAPAMYGQQMSFPVKLVKKLFGCKVLYDGKSSKVTVENGDDKAEFYCGSNTVLVNGKEIYLEHRILRYEDITYIPQTVLEKLIGNNVISNGETGIILPSGTEITQNNEQMLLNYAEIMINGGDF